MKLYDELLIKITPEPSLEYLVLTTSEETIWFSKINGNG